MSTEILSDEKVEEIVFGELERSARGLLPIEGSGAFQAWNTAFSQLGTHTRIYAAVKNHLSNLTGLARGLVGVDTTPNDPRPPIEDFDFLAHQWAEDTQFLSRIDSIIGHWAYQKIIALGPPAIPLLLREIESGNTFLVWALAKITKDDPSAPAQRGSISDMAKAWVLWGKANGRAHSWLERVFPNLRSTGYEVTGPPSDSYNCIAHAADDDGNWWDNTGEPGKYWPPVCDDGTIDALKAALAWIGYSECADGNQECCYEKIVLYEWLDPMDGQLKWSHAAKRRKDGRWSSKLGRGPIVAHNSIGGISGSDYGNPKCFMRRWWIRRVLRWLKVRIFGIRNRSATPRTHPKTP